MEGFRKDRRDNRNSSDRRGGFRRNFRPRDSDRPQEKHKAICSECGKECEVPFKPTEGREVFCEDCWKKRRRRF